MIVFRWRTSGKAGSGRYADRDTGLEGELGCTGYFGLYGAEWADASIDVRNATK